jgi:fibronectin type III domain protein
MKHRAGLAGAVTLVAILVAGGGGRARAQDAGTTALSSADFTLTLSRVSGTTTTPLTSDEVASYFSSARCNCPTNIVASLAISSTAAANLGASTVDAQLGVGSDCDNAAIAGCTLLGRSLTLTANQQTTTETIPTSTIFTAGGATTCATTPVGTRLWAIVRLDDTRLATDPSLALTLGGAGPAAPTGVTLTTASDGLLVSWTATGDATTLQGFQVLCSPAATTAAAPAYDTTCPAALPDGGAGPFATLDAQFLCSGLVPFGTTSTRVHGLTNGTAYQVAVVAVGIDGTPSAPSTVVSGMPGPTYGFEDIYSGDGGTAATGCDVGGGNGRGWGIAIVVGVASLAVALRRRKRRAIQALVVLVGLGCLGARPTRAQSYGADGDSILATPIGSAAHEESPHWWNFELRFGPYRPDVDSEFSDRGSAKRPYAQTFGSSRHLMGGVEIDRQVLHRGGTWAVGLGVGHYEVSAAALEANLTTRSGDQTSLRLIPVWASLVYRADILRERYHSPLVPYAKVGLDCSFWKTSDTSEPSTDGKTFGWHAAAGLSFDLSILDPEDAHAMDRDSGVNQTALFFEFTHDSLDGFGSGSVLHVGDTTWLAGLMVEM